MKVKMVVQEICFDAKNTFIPIVDHDNPHDAKRSTIPEIIINQPSFISYV